MYSQILEESLVFDQCSIPSHHSDWVFDKSDCIWESWLCRVGYLVLISEFSSILVLFSLISFLCTVRPDFLVFQYLTCIKVQNSTFWLFSPD